MMSQKQQDKPPYLMTREEWKKEMDKATPDGMPRYNAGGAGRSDTIAKLERKEFLCYGVHKWIYDKACEGIQWALEIWEFEIYDKYEMILKKAIEEGKLPQSEAN